MTQQATNKIVHPAGRFGGEVDVPGDKSISHRIGMLAALAAGESVVLNYLRSEDCMNTLQAMGSLGAHIHFHGQQELHIGGCGGRLIQPVAPLDMGNSGTGMRLLAGLLAGQSIEAVLTGDASLCSRPMERIRAPLAEMGAELGLEGAQGRPPIRIAGRPLHGITYAMPVASAQVKSALLLAGLFAEGTTRLVEPLETRDHTERLLRAMGVPVRTRGVEISLEGYGRKGPTLQAGAWTVPGDFSSAAFWMVAAAARPGAQLTVRNVGLNPRRTALLDVLERMGAQINVTPEKGSDQWEPVGEVQVVGRTLKATEIGGAEIPNLIDELPILAVAGALAEGQTVIRDAAELRVKESDRLATMAENLKKMGVEVEERPDGLCVTGPARLTASSELRSHGDHRIAMAMAVLALFGPEPSAIHNIACVQTSYPTFWSDLEKLSGTEGAS